MGEEFLDRVVRLLEDKGCATTNDLMHYLGISLQEVNTLLGVLISEGVIEEVDLSSRCNSCPVSSSCHMKSGKVLKAFKLRSSKSV